MAFNRSNFPNKIATGLWSNQDNTIFYYDFKVDNSRIRGTLDYSSKSWNLAMKSSVAKAHIQKLKDEKKELLSNELVKFDTFINRYFRSLKKTDWVKTKINHYEKYIKEYIGNKRVRTIKKNDIIEILDYQKKIGLKPRTIKTTLEVLNPVFKKAIENGIIVKNPINGIKVDIEEKDEIIHNPQQKLQQIYEVLYAVFKDDPIYLSMYLFALQGRSKSEILGLKWEYIDFEHNRYVVKPNGKSYILQPNVKDQLLKFKLPYGWVYESSHNRGLPISNIEKQTNKVKKLIPQFTIRYMQNVVKEVHEQQMMNLYVPNMQIEDIEENNIREDKPQINDNIKSTKNKIEQNTPREIKSVKLTPELNIGKFNKKT